MENVLAAEDERPRVITALVLTAVLIALLAGAPVTAGVNGTARAQLTADAVMTPGETDPPSGTVSGRLTCFVSILPLAYFAEQIGGNHVTIEVMVGPGQSPATYEPTAKQLSRLADARIFFSIGVPFEASILPRIKKDFKNVTIVDARSGIVPMEMSDGRDVGAKPAGGIHDHGRSGLDPHVWLSPRLAKTIAANIRDGLAAADPVHGSAYNANCDTLLAMLDELDRRIAAMMAPFKGRRFYVFHPAYGYFAAEYGLEQVAIELEGATPGPKHLAEVIDQAKADHVRVLFVQPQFSKNTAQMIADAIGAKIVTLDPLARDYPVNMLDIADRIAEALGGGNDSPPDGSARDGTPPEEP
ncbi:MAG: zinc ABC transporter substrate-binding protein [bacterium]